MTYNNNAVTTTYPAVTDSDIDALEQRIGEKLPPELRQHYLENNGGQLTHRECQSADGIDFHLHEFLPIVGPNRGFDLAFDVARRDPGFMPNNLLPFLPTIIHAFSANERTSGLDFASLQDSKDHNSVR